MTISGLLQLLEHLHFDVDEIPARRGHITLAELEYDEVDRYWRFRFRWNDIAIPVPTAELPAELWAAIKESASSGETNTMIFGVSEPSKWTDETPMVEILLGLRDELVEFTQEMERLTALVAPYCEQK